MLTKKRVTFLFKLQGGVILHAQFEIWKAASSEESMQWMPETASSNASSGDVSDGKFFTCHLCFFAGTKTHAFHTL